MYPVKNIGFGFFGRALIPSSILRANTEYTFTFTLTTSIFGFLTFASTESLMVKLRERLANFGYVQSVTRPLFSDHYIVKVIPSVSVSLANWLEAFDASFKDMGYEDYSFIAADEGAVSSQPGGIEEAITKPVGEFVGKGLWDILGPVIPYVLIAGVGYFLLVHGVPKGLKRGGGG